MLSVRVIPCLDIRDGKVVKGVRFQNLNESGDPVALAARYALEGADELVLLDVSATVEGRETALETVRAVRLELPIPLTVGGGVNSLGRALALLENGADKVSVNSAAVDRPGLLAGLAERFGTQCVVLAVDVAAGANTSSGYEVIVRSGTTRTGIDAVEWAKEGSARGAGEILLTSIERDGTREGYDLGLISAVREAVAVPIIASGGASFPEHMAEAVGAGADAVLAASIFHEEEWTVHNVKCRLDDLCVRVRS